MNAGFFNLINQLIESAFVWFNRYLKLPLAFPFEVSVDHLTGRKEELLVLMLNILLEVCFQQVELWTNSFAGFHRLSHKMKTSNDLDLSYLNQTRKSKLRLSRSLQQTQSPYFKELNTISHLKSAHHCHQHSNLKSWLQNHPCWIPQSIPLQQRRMQMVISRCIQVQQQLQGMNRRMQFRIHKDQSCPGE